MTANLLRIADLSGDGLAAVLKLASVPDGDALAGRGAALIFEYPSARTRNAAELAVVQLGGHPVTIRGEEVGFDVRESVEDVAHTLACFHSLIGARVAHHEVLERMVVALADAVPAVPVVNLLSDVEHPTQAVADLLTMQQCFGRLEGLTVAYFGDANNVCRSLAVACALSGATLRVASPSGYALSEEELASFTRLGGEVTCSDAPEDAARGADVLYTDVWVSMGEEAEGARKRAALEPYRLDARLVSLAGPEAIVLHCLPAHRGEEITAEVIDGPRSRVWMQAENRMHAMRGIFAFLLDAAQAG